MKTALARAAVLGLALMAGAPTLAQALNDQVVRLSPADREAAIEAGAQRAERELPINGLSRGVHGEMGVEVSSNGGRALYGTAVVPLGETGSAAFSFLTADPGRLRRR